MLSIPFKKTDASIDLAGPLRRYLMKEFSKVSGMITRLRVALEVFIRRRNNISYVLR